MQVVSEAIKRLERRSTEPKAVMFGLADDLAVIANALREIQQTIEKLQHEKAQ